MSHTINPETRKSTPERSETQATCVYLGAEAVQRKGVPANAMYLNFGVLVQGWV